MLKTRDFEKIIADTPATNGVNARTTAIKGRQEKSDGSMLFVKGLHPIVLPAQQFRMLSVTAAANNEAIKPQTFRAPVALDAQQTNGSASPGKK